MSDNIILIGFMGTGKDAVARLLSRRLNMGFLSTDEMIELSENKSISEIFKQYGEGYFRKKESLLIKKIAHLKNVIIATGGGLPVKPENRRTLEKMGIVIQLSANPQILKQRIPVKKERPLIRSISDIERLYKERQSIYDFARVKIDTTGKEPETVAQEIIHNLRLKKLINLQKREKIEIHTKSKNYSVIIGSNIISRIPLSHKRVVVVTNPLVGALYLNELISQLEKNYNEVYYYIIPDGEEVKNFKTVYKIYDFLFRLNFQRNDFLITLGGGVIVDITGFVASTFKRGCKVIHIPTTLVAQIDAGIGGKTGINTIYGKNMLGTFYQPEFVFCDLKYLLTLSEQEFVNGIAEAIKYSITSSKTLYRILKKERYSILNRNPLVLFEIIKKCILIKSRIIEKDETEEKGIREILNFGHTIGHIIETVTNYKKYSHGEAVAIGMIEEMKRLSKNSSEIDEIIALLEDYKLPCAIPSVIRKRIKELILQDKKKRGDLIRMPVFKEIGRVELKEVLCKRLC